MDVKTYATVTDLCARLAGRLEDDTLRSVREDYFGGEPAQAEATLLLTTAYENIGITREEHDLIQSTLDDPDSSDLAAVPIIDEVPPLRYRFSANAPASAPDPSKADVVLSADAARHGGRRLRRAWREPLDGAPDSPGGCGSCCRRNGRSRSWSRASRYLPTRPPSSPWHRRSGAPNRSAVPAGAGTWGTPCDPAPGRTQRAAARRA